ncbi:histidine phosphatase family protein [Limosilactobacillus gastricus]|uniref:Phosphoglycerate mutase n=1 Tax=Limosilactobacillus gastricus DSM 16045 TaxID=1423749 RepID=A0A0R1VJL2_9LACO|nr:histidine phosphatase family protein [Limosilactobacillus gastricus]KRM03126.1 phosphoglycerate mutase [Limosilactobacillus gastricus DSM 16045]QGF40539.1 histidine phosphatase family protein [Limosilactobacillus gastricus]
MTILYVVRHGQSVANSKGIMQGAKIDTPLTPLGRQQAQATKEHLSGISYDHVVASPLLRAHETAQIIAGNDANIHLDDRLKEYDYGDWDGELEATLWDKYQQYFDEHHNLLAGSWEVSHGDTYDQVKDRLVSLFDELVATYPDGKILVVSHGFTIKLMADLVLKIGNLTGLSEPSNAGLTKLVLTPSTKTLEFYGR